MNPFLYYTMIASISVTIVFFLALIPIFLLVVVPMEKMAKRDGIEVPSILFTFHPWALIHKVCGYAFAFTGSKPFGLSFFYGKNQLETFRLIRSRYSDSKIHAYLFRLIRFWTYGAAVGAYIAIIIVAFNWGFFNRGNRG